MVKSKPAAKKSPARTPARKPPVARKPAPAKKSAPPKEKFTDEYRDYLERYHLTGEGRPRLTPGEFERLDEEMLELLERQAEGRLDDEQLIRIQELEYLLLDDE